MAYTIKRFESPTQLLKELDEFLHKEEIINSMFIYMLLSPPQKSTSYCAAVYQQNSPMFALFGIENGYLYGSAALTDYKQEVIFLLAQDLLPFHFIGIQGFQPMLDILAKGLGTSMQFTGDVYSYTIQNVQWSFSSQQLMDQRMMLRPAIKKDTELLMQWTDEYLNNMVFFQKMDKSSIMAEELEQVNIFLLCRDGLPLSLAWKKRAYKKSVSIAYVYTPPVHRGQGFAELCVTLTTEHLLKTFETITLNTLQKESPENNLYARLGYTLFGKMGRYVLQ